MHSVGHLLIPLFFFGQAALNEYRQDLFSDVVRNGGAGCEGKVPGC